MNRPFNQNLLHTHTRMITKTRITFLYIRLYQLYKILVQINSATCDITVQGNSKGYNKFLIICSTKQVCVVKIRIESAFEKTD